MRRYLTIFIAVVMLCMLSGCFSRGNSACNKQQEYQESDSIEPLKVPADLDQPDRSSALSIPEQPPEAKERDKDDPCLENPPDYFGR